MEKSVIETKLNNLLYKHFGDSGLTENRDAEIKNEFDLDSIKMLEIILDIEEMFDIEISDEDSNELSTINKISEYIKNKKG